MIDSPTFSCFIERHCALLLERSMINQDYLGCLEDASLLLEVEPGNAVFERYLLEAAEKLGYDARVKRAMELCFYGRDPFELPEPFHTVRGHINRRAH